MEIIAVILVSVWKINRVSKWCIEKVNLSLAAIQYICETTTQQQKVITSQQTLIATQQTLISDLRKIKQPTVKDYYTQIFSTKN